MNPANMVGLICLLLLIGMGVTVVVNHFVVYAGTSYEMSIIKSHLALALDTHNIDAKVDYIDDTVERLQSYHGNSEWWYPTEKSDIDQTRGLLETVSVDVRGQLNVKEREHYFILPHNELVVYLNSEIKDAGQRLNSYAHGAYWHPDNNIVIYITLLGIPSLFIATIIFFAWGDSHDYKKRYEEKQNAKK